MKKILSKLSKKTRKDELLGITLLLRIAPLLEEAIEKLPEKSALRDLFNKRDAKEIIRLLKEGSTDHQDILEQLLVLIETAETPTKRPEKRIRINFAEERYRITIRKKEGLTEEDIEENGRVIYSERSNTYFIKTKEGWAECHLDQNKPIKKFTKQEILTKIQSLRKEWKVLGYEVIQPKIEGAMTDSVEEDTGSVSRLISQRQDLLTEMVPELTDLILSDPNARWDFRTYLGVSGHPGNDCWFMTLLLTEISVCQRDLLLQIKEFRGLFKRVESENIERGILESKDSVLDAYEEKTSDLEKKQIKIALKMNFIETLNQFWMQPNDPQFLLAFRELLLIAEAVQSYDIDSKLSDGEFEKKVKSRIAARRHIQLDPTDMLIGFVTLFDKIKKCLKTYLLTTYGIEDTKEKKYAFKVNIWDKKRSETARETDIETDFVYCGSAGRSFEESLVDLEDGDEPGRRIIESLSMEKAPNTLLIQDSGTRLSSIIFTGLKTSLHQKGEIARAIYRRAPQNSQKVVFDFQSHSSASTTGIVSNGIIWGKELYKAIKNLQTHLNETKLKYNKEVLTKILVKLEAELANGISELLTIGELKSMLAKIDFEVSEFDSIKTTTVLELAIVELAMLDQPTVEGDTEVPQHTAFLTLCPSKKFELQKQLIEKLKAVQTEISFPYVKEKIEEVLQQIYINIATVVARGMPIPETLKGTDTEVEILKILEKEEEREGIISAIEMSSDPREVETALEKYRSENPSRLYLLAQKGRYKEQQASYAKLFPGRASSYTVEEFLEDMETLEIEGKNVSRVIGDPNTLFGRAVFRPEENPGAQYYGYKLEGISLYNGTGQSGHWHSLKLIEKDVWLYHSGIHGDAPREMSTEEAMEKIQGAEKKGKCIFVYTNENTESIRLVARKQEISQKKADIIDLLNRILEEEETWKTPVPDEKSVSAEELELSEAFVPGKDFNPKRSPEEKLEKALEIIRKFPFILEIDPEIKQALLIQMIEEDEEKFIEDLKDPSKKIASKIERRAKKLKEEGANQEKKDREKLYQYAISTKEAVQTYLVYLKILTAKEIDEIQKRTDVQLRILLAEKYPGGAGLEGKTIETIEKELKAHIESKDRVGSMARRLEILDAKEPTAVDVLIQQLKAAYFSREQIEDAVNNFQKEIRPGAETGLETRRRKWLSVLASVSEVETSLNKKDTVTSPKNKDKVSALLTILVLILNEKPEASDDASITTENVSRLSEETVLKIATIIRTGEYDSDEQETLIKMALFFGVELQVILDQVKIEPNDAVLTELKTKGIMQCPTALKKEKAKIEDWIKHGKYKDLSGWLEKNTTNKAVILLYISHTYGEEIATQIKRASSRESLDSMDDNDDDTAAAAAAFGGPAWGDAGFYMGEVDEDTGPFGLLPPIGHAPVVDLLQMAKEQAFIESAYNEKITPLQLLGLLSQTENLQTRTIIVDRLKEVASIEELLSLVGISKGSIRTLLNNILEDKQLEEALKLSMA